MESENSKSFTVKPKSSSMGLMVSTWNLELASALQKRMPTFLASGKKSCRMAACWSSGARSEVPETLRATLRPSHSSISKAAA